MLYNTDASIGHIGEVGLRIWRRPDLQRLVLGEVGPFKRLLDVTVATTALICLAPFLAVTAFLIKLHDGGPVFFWQTRVGRGGREFPFPKFRSMVVNAERLKDQLAARNDHDDSITFKMKRDPRITPIGRFIRKFSVDELPQLWCVLAGDMTLVGPRPALPREVACYLPSDFRRLEVVPGLTCIWQVSGRGDLPFERQLELDIHYIEHQSLWLDLYLLVMTVPAVLLGKGAY
jgi:lipopolysaccharide/colanic/teichoic acid biosynthesis glycosyltransferase